MASSGNTLTLRLLGPGELLYAGRTVRLHSAKALSLLAYLSLETGRAHSRASLAALLWAGASESAARQSLRQALYSLRTMADAVLDHALQVDHDVVQLLPSAGLEVDAVRFLDLARSHDPADWRDAACLYRAELFEGRSFGDDSEFQEWLLATRERLHAVALHNLDRLAAEATARGDWDAAIAHAEALRRHDAASEPAARHLLRAYAAAGRPGAVEAEWRRLCDRLQRDFGVVPSSATASLYRTLRGPVDASPPSHTEPTRSLGPAFGPALARPTAGADEAEAFVRAARAAERVHAFSQAADLLARARQLLARAAPHLRVRRFEVLLLEEAVLERLGRRAEQLAAIDDAIELAESLGEVDRIAAALLRRAGACAYLDRPGEACAAAAQALDGCRRLGDRPGEAEALRELAFVHWRAGEYSEAVAYARDALSLHRQLGDVAGEATALHNLAEIHRSLGSPRQALGWYRQALPLHWAAGNVLGEVLSLFGVANALRHCGDGPGARRHYAQALALAERHGERTMQARALHALATHHAELGDLDNALACMRGAVEVDRAIGYAHALGHDLVDLAGLHQRRGERSEARALLEEALVWFSFTEDPADAAAAHSRIADLELGRDVAYPPASLRRGVRSHLPLGEGKVYCEFESPLRR